MNLFLEILKLVVFLSILVFSARLIEKTFVHISHKVKVNEFFLGFAVLGVITTLPEISIVLFSSQTNPELSLGNLYGGTIIMLTLIIGISAIKFKNIKFAGGFAEGEVLLGVLLLASSIIPVLDNNFTFIEGILGIAAYISYIIFLYFVFKKKTPARLYTFIDSTKLTKLMVGSIIGIFGLMISSSLTVVTAENIANMLNVSDVFIGLFVLGLGTNLPEITIMITSKGGQEQSLALGNFFGSACVNVGVLGMLAIISGGFSITGIESLLISLTILVLTLFLFSIFSWTGRKLDRTEGVVLVALYIALIVAEVLALGMF